MYSLEEVKAVNMLVMEERNQQFIVRKPALLQNIVFKAFHNYEYLTNSREKIIKKAGYLMTAITYLQPFDDGNKSTGLLLCVDYLQCHGLDLPRDTYEQKLAIDVLLLEVMLSTKSYNDVEAFLMKNVVSRL